jgi:hypothetical protein
MEQPISQDHIIKINPSEDIILALDPDSGKELCRFNFQVNGKQVYFKTPTWGKWDGFKKKLTELFVYLMEHAPNIDARKADEEEADLVKLFRDPAHNPAWRKLSGAAISTRKRVRNLVLEIFFDYLDGYIDGLEINYPQKGLLRKREMTDNEKKKHFTKVQAEWFIENARIDDSQRVFSACLAVEDLVKKNAIFILKKEMPNILSSLDKSSADILPLKQASTSKSSTSTASSTLKRL